MLGGLFRGDRRHISGLLQDESLRIVSNVSSGPGWAEKGGDAAGGRALIGTRGTPDSEFDFAERIYTMRSDITILLLVPAAFRGDHRQGHGERHRPRHRHQQRESDIRKDILTTATGYQPPQHTLKIASYDSKIAACFSAKGGVGKTPLAR
jgi:hypothetical protein